MSKINQVLLSQKQPELGLVCITSSDAVRFRTVTRKRLLQLTEIEQEKVLRELYADNLKRLDKAIDFCYANGIKARDSGRFADCCVHRVSACTLSDSHRWYKSNISSFVLSDSVRLLGRLNCDDFLMKAEGRRQNFFLILPTTFCQLTNN